MKIHTDIAEQARTCFATIDDVLRQAGFSREDIVRVQYTVVSADLIEDLVPVLGVVLGAIRPAATMVIAGLIRPEMLVEIEVTAFKG
jgi:enamine deaminase RidA (YjgF/YER057c/UK114 family)